MDKEQSGAQPDHSLWKAKSCGKAGVSEDRCQLKPLECAKEFLRIVETGKSIHILEKVSGQTLLEELR